MYFVTGASDNHFKSLVQFIKSLTYTHWSYTFVWDLGLSCDNLHFLHTSFPSLNIRRFPYEEYPSYFNIHVAAGEYAWKPVAIWRTALEIKSGILLWCDAGNRVMYPGCIESAKKVIESQGVFSPISSGTIRKWTHPVCLDWFHIQDTDCIMESPPRNGAIVGFDLDQSAAWQLLETWALLAQQKECIAPIGSSRENHRQDQAVFTLLYYRYTGGKELEIGSCGIAIHMDCD